MTVDGSAVDAAGDDVLVLRRQFPLLAQGGSTLHYLDNAATGQIHEAALEAMIRHERSGRGNVLRSGHRLAHTATQAYHRARGQVAHFIHAASAEEVVFTSGATAALNLVAQAYGALCKAGDEIVLSVSEHHSNLLPWQQLRDRAGIALRFVPLGPDARLDLPALRARLGPRCRLVALTHASNVTGAVTDVATVVEQARTVGARVLLDGAQRAPHGPVDVQALGIDFYAFSGHKCFGPGGVGVLWARRELLEAMPPAATGGGMVERVSIEGASYADPPRRFEAGTPPVAQAVGLGEALDWMGGQDWPRIERRMQRLTARLIEGLLEVRGLHIAGPLDTRERLPVVSFWLDRMHSHDVCQVLDGMGVALRGGHHCAQPLMQALGTEGVSRASLALYNGDDDVDALLAGVREAVRILA
jgi:cysteine desulfurase/selenocysteine lyase